MYLKGSSLSLKKKRRRGNPGLVFFLVVAIGLLIYVNVFVVPDVNPPFVPTPTDTRDPLSFEIEADALASEGKFVSAIDTYQAAINSNPQNVDNYLKIARLQIYAGQFEQAKVNAENAILLNKQNSNAYALLGWAKGFQELYLEGELDAKKAIEIDPNNAMGHAVYAFLLALRLEADLEELTTMDMAIEESRTALALDSNLLESRWARGYVLEITSNYADAAEQYEIAIQINPNISELHIALGRNYMTLSQFDEAVFEFTKAYSLNPTDPEPNYLISRVYGNLGEWAKGIQYGEQALKDDPSDPFLYANVGTMHYRSGQYNQAIPYLEKAVKGGTTEEGVVVQGIPLAYTTGVIEIYSRYGLSLARVNRCNEAVQVANGMLQTIADNPDGVFNAEEIIRICQENLTNPPTATPAPTATPVTGPSPTPQGTPAAKTTPTP
ncbi:MAG: tetratricopeptide repeat protein [Anaerolineaceae bacterium]